MSDKKHIDRIFQEGFKDFEAAPSDAVWKNIEAKLNEKKKKRRVVPIWWQYAGIAAALLILLTIGGIYFNNSEEGSTNPIVETENTIPENTILGNENINDTSETNQVVLENSKEEESNKTSNLNAEAPLITDQIDASNETTVAETNTSTIKNQSKSKLVSSDKTRLKNNLNNQNTDPVANASEDKNEQISLPKNVDEKTSVANLSETVKVENVTETLLVDKEKAEAILNDALKDDTKIADTSSEIENNVTVDENSENNELSIEEAINISKDIIDEESNNQKNKWTVSPNAAPIYFNTLGEGSSIDPQFNNNSKSGEINMSYGIAASYALNKKLKIRSGINRVNLGYNTNDVIVFQSTGSRSSSSALQNVSGANRNSDDVSFISSETLSSSNATESIASSNASINQALGYIEIPLEIQYTLSDKKFGVNVIGGFSSLFLNDNEIYSQEENGTRTYLGEASNINKTSYSANFGLGLNYKVSKRFDLNLEPIFKYQFNTFNNTSGNFSPYFIGVYTGFAIKF
ncbi:hypothetical protein [Algibacter luteus]|uniref:hypothetical protein n=1 Tax=Algibacter luteus TaxID=1178825 RepID=UPI002595FB3E|nr:hypothetical protein [Algibacter luteus]WJJ97136.1 hypothetical protein O5O44_01890 [Algibacter luteus]